MLIDRIAKYLRSKVSTPFFFCVGDCDYPSTIDQLAASGLDVVRISEFCNDADKWPNLDNLFDQLRTADVNFANKKMLILGLGEYLTLRGSDEAQRVLSRLKDLSLGTAKAVLLLRGVTKHVDSLKADPRFDERRHFISGERSCDMSVTIVDHAMSVPALDGVKALLFALESGKCREMVVHTTVSLDRALVSVRKISDYHGAIRLVCPRLDVPSECGSSEQWERLLQELNQNSGSFDSVLKLNGVGSVGEESFRLHTKGSGYANWLYFIALKAMCFTLPDGYLRRVVETTNEYNSFKARVLGALSDLPHTDKRFQSYYRQRKELIAGFPESDVAAFVVSNRINGQESIFRLTDCTRTEREEIIAWVSKFGVPSVLPEIYPALSAYLTTYVFNSGELSALLTEYFEAYKRQKVSNCLEDEFLEWVDELAEERPYNRLPSRSELLDRLEKDDTHLFWLDSLGAEYLAFISDLVRSHGLSASIGIARAELPTITSINRSFFDEWPSVKKEKSNELDDVKHREAGGYNFESNALPIHLAKELDIITQVVEKAATGLAMRKHERFLIVSDHGASRLAVMHRQMEKYDTDTKGEHSGRCCEAFAPYDLPHATEENGYLVLADYGRFKGSRAGNVEVHGGASLEEVVVPIIELRLRDRNIRVSMIEDSVPADRLSGAEITLFSESRLKALSIVIDGKRYRALMVDDNHYRVELADIRRAGEYQADVCEGDDLIGHIVIKTHGKSAKVKDDFDDLFKEDA